MLTFTLTVSDGRLSATDTVTVTVTALPPLAPTGLTARADGERAVALAWTAPEADRAVRRAAVTGYRVEVSADGESGWSQAGTTDAATASFRHGGLAGGTTRHYRVRARSAVGDSASSSVVSATTDAVLTGESPVEVPDEHGDPVQVTSDTGVVLGTERRDADGDGDLDTVLTFRAPAGDPDHPVGGVRVTLPDDTVAGNTRSVTVTTLEGSSERAAAEAAEPPAGMALSGELLAVAVDLEVPPGSRVCLPFDGDAGEPVLYHFDGARWERDTVEEQRVEGALVCGTVRAASPFAVFHERGPVASAAAHGWLARFGRTVAEQVLEAVDARMAAPRTAGTELTLGGQRVARDGAAKAEDAEDEAPARDLAAWRQGAEDPEAAWRRGEPGDQGMSGRELLLGSAFSFADGEERTGHYALWGRAAVSRFDGRAGTLTLDGEVASALLGADWRRERTTLGLIVGHSVGDGGYSSNDASGTVSPTLTGLYPWMRHSFGERVSVWGVAGYGEGRLTVTPENAHGGPHAALDTDLELTMGTVGLRATLLEGSETGGVELALRTDAMGVRTRSAPVTGAGVNLAGANAEVTRLRLGLEGSGTYALDGAATLTPQLEVGVRHDGGDAETGVGVEVGGGLGWSDPSRSLSAEVSGRALLAHAEDDYREWGAGASVVLDPGANGRGMLLRLASSRGTTDGGAERMWAGDAKALANLAANDDAPAVRLDTELGYGLPALGGRGTLTPYGGLTLAGEGARDWRLGVRLKLRSSLSLSLEGTRRESAGAGSEHAIGFQLRADW